jgi:hypothetical protein
MAAPRTTTGGRLAQAERELGLLRRELQRTRELVDVERRRADQAEEAARRAWYVTTRLGIAPGGR